jgi:hypothetical protein
VAGAFSFSVTVLDTSDPPLTNTRTLSITIQPALSITTTSLPGGTVGVTYSQTLGAANGTPPYSWSVSSGTLASGLSLSSTGVLAGNPTASGSYTFDANIDVGYCESPTADPIALTDGTTKQCEPNRSNWASSCSLGRVPDNSFGNTEGVFCLQRSNTN